MKKVSFLVLSLFILGCSEPQNNAVSENKREIKVEDINWLENQNWSPKQTETAASFYQVTQYDQNNDKEIKIIEKKAAQKDLNAIYATNAGRELAEINEPLTYDEKFKIYKKYYELAQAGQINAKVKLLHLYNDEEMATGGTSFDLLKKITQLDDKKIQDLMSNYFDQTISAGRRGEIKEYTAFIINNKQPETDENSFDFNMYFQDLGQVKVLKNKGEMKKFSNTVQRVFDLNRDGNLAYYLMQIYALDSSRENLEKACIYSEKLKNTEYANEKLFQEVHHLLEKNKIACEKNGLRLEFDKPKLNQWYVGWES